MSNQGARRFTPTAEIWNGRVAMLGFALAIATEALTGEGIIGQIASLFNF